MVNDYTEEAHIWYAKANRELLLAAEQAEATGPRDTEYRYIRARAYCEMGVFAMNMSILHPNSKPEILTANDIEVPTAERPAPEPVKARRVGKRPVSQFEKGARALAAVGRADRAEMAEKAVEDGLL